MMLFDKMKPYNKFSSSKTQDPDPNERLNSKSPSRNSNQSELLQNVHSQMNMKREVGDDDPNIINAMEKDSRFNYMDSMEDRPNDPNSPRGEKSELRDRI